MPCVSVHVTRRSDARGTGRAEAGDRSILVRGASLEGRSSPTSSLTRVEGSRRRTPRFHTVPVARNRTERGTPATLSGFLVACRSEGLGRDSRKPIDPLVTKVMWTRPYAVYMEQGADRPDVPGTTSWDIDRVRVA